MEELKPCPFCGSFETEFNDHPETCFLYRIWKQNQTDCQHYCKEAVEESWNTRPSPWIPVENLPTFMTESAYPPSDKQWLTWYLVLEHEALLEEVKILTAAEIWLDEGSEVELYMPIPEKG